MLVVDSALVALMVSVTWVCKLLKAIQNQQNMQKPVPLLLLAPITFSRNNTKTNFKDSATKISDNGYGQSTASQSAINSNSMRDARVAETLWIIKSVLPHSEAVMD